MSKGTRKRKLRDLEETNDKNEEENTSSNSPIKVIYTPAKAPKGKRKRNRTKRKGKDGKTHKRLSMSTGGKHRDSLLPSEIEKCTDGICHICQEWGDIPDDYCACCFHGYHSKCVSKYTTNKDDNWNDCKDLGFECANSDDNDKPILFEFIGNSLKQCKINSENCDKNETNKHFIEEALSLAWKKKHGKSKEMFLKKSKKKSKSKGKNDKNKNVFSYEIERTYYKGFKFQNKEFMIGDDIEITMENSNEICRILEIFKDNDTKYAWMKIEWYWHAKHVADNPNIRVNHKTGNGKNINPNEFELYFDLTWIAEYSIDTINDKVTVTDSIQNFLKLKHESIAKKDFAKIFWCVHGYDSDKRKKQVLPPHFIKNRIMSEDDEKIDKKENEIVCQNSIEYDAECRLLAASKELQLSSLPDKLPCRENEHNDIYSFILNAVKQGTGIGSGLYISGMPGTGKTATVRQIANELKQLYNQGKLKNNFEYNEINAMKLPTPQHVYSELYKIIFFNDNDDNDENNNNNNGNKKYVQPSTAARKLEKYFSNKSNFSENKMIHVLLIDELDYLLTKKQNVIYNLFDWPTKCGSSLVVIGIANTMDLPERLMPRVSSRLGLKRVVFKAYNRQQLERIIFQRLNKLNVFSEDAIRYCCMSVAGVSGDCRTALQICQQAVNIALTRVKKYGIKKIKIASNNKDNRDNNGNDNENESNESNESNDEMDDMGEPAKKRRRKLASNEKKEEKNESESNEKKSKQSKQSEKSGKSKNGKMEIDDDDNDDETDNDSENDSENDSDDGKMESENDETESESETETESQSDDDIDIREKYKKYNISYQLVQLDDIKHAKKCFDQSNDIQFISSTLGIIEKLFLTSIIVCNKAMSNNNHNDINCATLDQYRRRTDTYIATHLGGKKLTQVELLSICDKLQSVGLIQVLMNQNSFQKWIQLNYQSDDIVEALKQDNNCVRILAGV